MPGTCRPVRSILVGVFAIFAALAPNLVHAENTIVDVNVVNPMRASAAAQGIRIDLGIGPQYLLNPSRRRSLIAAGVGIPPLNRTR